MQVDWIRRLQGRFLGIPPTRPGDLFQVVHSWWGIRRGKHRRQNSVITFEKDDLILVMPGDRWPTRAPYDYVPCSVHGEIIYVEQMELWEKARLIG